MAKLLIFDAFMLLICEKNVENYALLRCKTFSLKIWLCKILDKYHVWTQIVLIKDINVFAADLRSMLKSCIEAQWRFEGARKTYNKTLLTKIFVKRVPGPSSILLHALVWKRFLSSCWSKKGDLHVKSTSNTSSILDYGVSPGVYINDISTTIDNCLRPINFNFAPIYFLSDPGLFIVYLPLLLLILTFMLMLKFMLICFDVHFGDGVGIEAGIDCKT